MSDDTREYKVIVGFEATDDMQYWLGIDWIEEGMLVSLSDDEAAPLLASGKIVECDAVREIINNGENTQ